MPKLASNVAKSKIVSDLHGIYDLGIATAIIPQNVYLAKHQWLPTFARTSCYNAREMTIRRAIVGAP